MKKLLLIVTLVFAFLFVLASCDNGDEPMLLGNITVAVGQSYKLPDTLEGNKNLEYTYESENFKIENGILTGISESEASVPVVAKSDGYESTFNVTVIDAGVMEIEDLKLNISSARKPYISFSDKSFESDVCYSFEGDNISIDEQGKIKGLKLDTVTAVTATTKYHTAVFLVTVVQENYGKLVIDAPQSIYTNYSGKPITVSFSNPDYASEVSYTTDNDKVYVHNGKIYAKGSFDKAVKVTVTAKTPYHTETFSVNVSEYNANISAEKKVSYYEKELIKAENKGGLIFVGDSYFDGYTKGAISYWKDFYEDYSGEKAFLMGISQAQIDNLEVVSERIVYPMAPSEIVVHIGFNDVHHGPLTADELAARIIALFETYRRELPNVKVYFCSIEAKKNSDSTSNTNHYASFVKAPAVNDKIQQYAQSHSWLTYVDTRSLVVRPNGTVDSNFFLSTDMSHPTVLAYDLYRREIELARNSSDESD